MKKVYKIQESKNEGGFRFTGVNWEDNNVDKITKELLNENPLKALINIKKLVKSLPTNDKSANCLMKHQIIMMIESYDNGMIVKHKDVIPAIRGIINDLLSSYKTYDDGDIIEMIFENPQTAYDYITY